MDPITALGAAAAITQFAGSLASITLKIVDFYGRFKEAPEVARKQLLHVNQLNLIAGLIIQNGSLQTEEIKSCLQSCLETLKKIEYRAQKVAGSKFQRLGAVITEDKMIKLFDELLKEKMSLSLCIQTIDAQALDTIGVRVYQIQEDLQRLSDGIRKSTSDGEQILSGVQCIDERMSEVNANLNSVADAMPMMTATLQNIVNEVRTASLRLERMAGPGETQQQNFINIPNRRTRYFVGRKDILSLIDSARESSSAKIPVAIIRGMGGQGKTQIALEYCFLKRNNPFEAMFWLNATSETTVSSSFETIFEAVKPSTVAYTSPEAKFRFVSQWLSTRKTPWLLVFDNFDKADFRILDFFPVAGNGFVIITTRNAVTEDIVTEQDIYIDLPSLDDDAALDLLMKSSSQKLNGDSIVENGRAIVRKLGNHALAINQAGSYIKSLKLDFSRFLSDYDSRKQKVLKTTPALTEYRRKIGEQQSDKETALNVFTTWELSFEQLVEETSENSSEVRLLTLFAYFDNQDISELLFRNFDFHLSRMSTQTVRLLDWLSIFKLDGEWDSDTFREVLGRLTNLSLVQSWEDRDDGSAHATLHPLVMTWIKLRTSNNDTKANLVAMWHILGTTTDSHWSVEQNRYLLTPGEQQELAKHIIIAMENSKGEDFPQGLRDDLALSRWHSADFMYDTSRYVHSATICKDVLKTWRLEDPPDFRVIGVLCASLDNSGQYLEAKEFLDRLVDLRRGIQLKSDREKLRTLQIEFWRGRNLVELGELGKGEAMLRDGLSRIDEVRKLDRSLSHRYNGVLGLLMHKRKDYIAAERYQRLSWLEWVKYHGTQSAATYNAMGELGITLADMGRREESIDMLEGAMAGLVTEYGPGFLGYVRFKSYRDRLTDALDQSVEGGTKSV